MIEEINIFEFFLFLVEFDEFVELDEMSVHSKIDYVGTYMYSGIVKMQFTSVQTIFRHGMNFS